jgi:hypothetical protein
MTAVLPSRPGDAVAAGADRLDCSLAWATCSTSRRCTTRIICTFRRAHDRSELASHRPVVLGANLPGEAAAELAWRLAELRPGMSVWIWRVGTGAGLPVGRSRQPGHWP